MFRIVDSRFILLIFVLLPRCPHCIDASSSPGSFDSSRSESGKFSWGENGKNSPPPWSFTRRIDPSEILSVLTRVGGLALPESIDRDLALLRQVLSVEKSEINVVERKLILYNFSVGLKGTKRALRIRRVFVRWDSYVKPCLEIELDDAEILVEFTNLLLTRSNWNELQEIGFPPDFRDDDSSDNEKEDYVLSTFLRFGSVDLSGMIKVRLESRRLEKKIHSFSFDMDATDDLKPQIARWSDVNLARTGRRGCTTAQLKDLAAAYFKLKIQNYLQSLADNPGSAMEEAAGTLSQAAEAILSYVGDAGRVAGEDVQDALLDKLHEMGVRNAADKVSFLRRLSLRLLNRVDVDALMDWLEQLQQMDATDTESTYSTTTSTKETVDVAMIFPDW